PGVRSLFRAPPYPGGRRDTRESVPSPVRNSCCCSLSAQCEEPVSQFPQRPVNPHFDGPHFTFHGGGDLVVFQVQEPAHDEHFSFIFRQRGQSPVQKSGFLLVLNLSVRRRFSAAEVR